MPEILIFLTILIASYLGVEAFRRWSLRRNLYDIPNERSSHTVPTPRGGGLVIVVASLCSYTIYAFVTKGVLEWQYLCGAILVAGVSWLDDLYSVSFVWRFLAHAAAALLIVFSVGYFREIYFPILEIHPGGEIFGIVLTFLWIVWLTNAYNFMDGIDGIAGLQAIAAGIGWLIIGKLLGAESEGFYGGVIASTAFGFTIQNWQPAKIFMGDVGSAFLGYTFAVLPLLLGRELLAAGSPVYAKLPLIAVALNWLFVFDTIYTFLRRLLRKEKVWQAHRGHVYQKLILAGFSHQKIAGLYGLISFVNVILIVLWLNIQRAWEFVLIFFMVFQAIGLLASLYLIGGKTNSSE